MDTQKALEVKRAILLLSDLLEMSPKDLTARICFYEKDKMKILREASDEWNRFDDADIVERCRVFGYNVIINNSTK